MGHNIVHVIGTGTIGEPLIGLLAIHKAEFSIDEVTFHKNMPYSHDRPKLLQMIKKGANMATRKDRIGKFKAQGIEVAYEQEEAIARATVVIDCTPSGIGIDNKKEFYNKYRNKVRGFIAQGSEFGFGTMYARGINDEVLDDSDPQFAHVVSCNTHNLAALLQTLGDDSVGGLGIEEARFVCLRRANDISQNSSFVPAPQLGVHSDPRFGTHHAHDAYHLFKTRGHELNLYSSTVKLEHTVHARGALLDSNQTQDQPRRSTRPAAREQARGINREALGQRHLLVRSRARSLRPHPEPYGGAHPSPRGPGRSRDSGLLLHATGWQFIAVFDRADIKVVGSGQRVS